MTASDGPRFYGKYRGVVTKNDDDQHLGRIKAMVPDVFGDEDSGWAMPSVPYAGKNVGLFLLPPEKASVWIEFEHGDPDYPIWSGCFWASGEVPASPYSADTKVLKTGAGTVTIKDDANGAGITIEAKGMKVVIDGKGIEIRTDKSAKVKLNGKKVTINDGAFEVQ